MLIAALLAVALIPYPVLADQPGTPGCHHGCRVPAQANMQRWTAQLTDVMTNSWVVNQGLSGTSPASGQAYVAVSDGLAAIGLGLSVQAFTENGGKPLWHQELAGFPDGAQIVSVRTWPDEVTVGVVAGTRRTEVILDGTTGAFMGSVAFTGASHPFVEDLSFNYAARSDTGGGTSAPEPTTLSLFAAAMAVAGLLLRRRRPAGLRGDCSAA